MAAKEGEMEEAQSVELTSSEFRKHFYAGDHSDMGKKERKERVKKYGHVNAKEAKRAKESQEREKEKEGEETVP